jgi:hypothetical protein
LNAEIKKKKGMMGDIPAVTATVGDLLRRYRLEILAGTLSESMLKMKRLNLEGKKNIYISIKATKTKQTTFSDNNRKSFFLTEVSLLSYMLHLYIEIISPAIQRKMTIKLKND